MFQLGTEISVNIENITQANNSVSIVHFILLLLHIPVLLDPEAHGVRDNIRDKLTVCHDYKKYKVPRHQKTK